MSAAQPIRCIPLGLLGTAEMRGANLLAASITASTTPAMFLAVLYVQNVLGLSPGRAALYFPALNITVIAGSLTGPRLLTRLGPRSAAIAGLGLVTAGALALTTLPSHGIPTGRLLTSFALMGLGWASPRWRRRPSAPAPRRPPSVGSHRGC